jgi:hypothetical protein
MAHLKDRLSLIFSTQDDLRYELLSKWNNIMGTLSDKVRLEKVHNETIVIGVYDPCWMQELYLLSRELLHSINNQLSKPFVKEIKFKAAAQTKRYEKKSIYQQQPTHIQIPLTEQELKALEKVTDEQLRSVLKDFLIRCRK